VKTLLIAQLVTTTLLGEN